MLLEVYCFGPAYTNTILLGCSETKKGAIIDAPQGCAEHLIEQIKKNGLDVEMLLLTHSHWDHFADAAILKKTLNVAVYVHELDAHNLRDPGADGLPLLIDVPPVEPTHFLYDGEKISVGNLTLEVIHTPGHSPGCVCFYLENEGVLISGDTLFKGSIGNLSFPMSQPDKMWESLTKLGKLPSETRVIPGHGAETTIKDESWIFRGYM